MIGGNHMIHKSFVFFLVCMMWGGIVGAGQLQIKIVEPQNGSIVTHRHYIRGTVSDPEADVWVVIHPVETSGFWVQPPVTVKNDGSWKVKAYLGRSVKDSGAEFEIRAFANPNESLREGETFIWPKAAARTDVVEVTRGK